MDPTYWRFQNLRSRHTFNKTPHILSDVTFQWRDKIPTGTPQEVDKSLKKHTGARNNFLSHFLDLIKNKNAILKSYTVCMNFKSLFYLSNGKQYCFGLLGLISFVRRMAGPAVGWMQCPPDITTALNGIARARQTPRESKPAPAGPKSKV